MAVNPAMRRSATFKLKCFELVQEYRGGPESKQERDEREAVTLSFEEQLKRRHDHDRPNFEVEHPPH